MSEPVPSYAIVGHPNEGKSSVVATLAEDDSVRISDLPGETIRCRKVPLRIGGETVLEFVDTPGFQNPRYMVRCFEEAIAADHPPVETFLARNRDHPTAKHDCALLEPIAAGAGIIYVVDGSRPPGAIDFAEMEVLRLSGLPRIAILNRKRDAKGWIEKWREACSRAFSTMREFNAHAAPFAERIRFLETLQLVDHRNEAELGEVVRRFREDREKRIGAITEILLDWVVEALGFQYSHDYDSNRPVAEEEAVARQRFWEELDRREAKVWTEFRKILRHRRYQPDLSGSPLVDAGLGSKETWQLLGLTRKQLMTLSAILGAGAGAAVDVAAAGITFGVFTALGAAGGAAGVWFGGDAVKEAKIRRVRLGSPRLEVGPNRSDQFPFIVLDRSLLYLRLLLERTHAHRETETAPAGEAKEGLVSRIPEARRKALARWIRKAGSERGELREEAAAVLREVLEG